MSHTLHQPTTRRDFLKHSGTIACASALAATFVPHVHAAEDSTIQVALIGCGGRGTGAAANALAVKEGHQAGSHGGRVCRQIERQLQRLEGAVRGPRGRRREDRRFLGFDGYRKAMDCLKPGDVAILATPPAFRWVHFTYAIEKGLNVFMEKPVTVDGPRPRRCSSWPRTPTRRT